MNIHEFENIKKVSVIARFREDELAQVNAFDSTGSIMVSRCNNDIKVWKFIGKAKQLRRLKGHKDLVSCIVFSKKNFWFVSGGRDTKIILWSQNLIQKVHTGQVNHLILNKNEDELISCGNDKTIKIWKVNNQSIQFQYSISLQGSVYSASLNESETYLVSCQEETIILWLKNEKNKWKYQNEIKNTDEYHKICFIGNNFCALQNLKAVVPKILEIKNGKLIQRNDLEFKINKYCQGNNLLYKLIYNSNHRILVQSKENFIYFLRKQDDGKLKMIEYPINCFINYNSGNLTFILEFMVVWKSDFRFFIVYKRY